LLLYPRVQRWGLLWRDILKPEELPSSMLPLPGVILMGAGALTGLIVGFGLSTGLYHARAFTFSAGSTGSGVALGVIPFILLYFVGLAIVER
jgi:energy-coupling factor transport system substrate-specific component